MHCGKILASLIVIIVAVHCKSINGNKKHRQNKFTSMCKVQGSTVQGSTVQGSTVQGSTVQGSTGKGYIPEGRKMVFGNLKFRICMQCWAGVMVPVSCDTMKPKKNIKMAGSNAGPFGRFRRHAHRGGRGKPKGKKNKQFGKRRGH